MTAPTRRKGILLTGATHAVATVVEHGVDRFGSRAKTADAIGSNYATLNHWTSGRRSPQQASTLWDIVEVVGGRLVLIRPQTIAAPRVVWSVGTAAVLLKVLFHLIDARYKHRVDFAREIFLPRDLLRLWERGERGPSLDSLYRVIDGLALHLVYVPEDPGRGV